MNRALTEESHRVIQGKRSVRLSAFGWECVFLVCFWIVVIVSLINAALPMPSTGAWPR